MTRGCIIFLNGTSSSGKTTIAKALQEKLAEPRMHVSMDGFFYMYPERVWNPASQEEETVTIRLTPAIISGMSLSVAALAEAGNHLIVDHVMEDRSWLEECLERWRGLEVLFVGVRCPLEVADQREAERGDRMIGLARYQHERVHAHGHYDVEVDTSKMDVDTCVEVILEGLAREDSARVFPILVREVRKQKGGPK
jgi:chloramphenicol 3-O phosphotransferase